jgi:hypothetical protein
MDGEVNKYEGNDGIYLRCEIVTAVPLKLIEDFYLLGYNAV